MEVAPGEVRVKWRRLVLSVQHIPKLPYERQHRILLPILEQILGEVEAAGLQGRPQALPGKLILNGAGEFATGGPDGDNGLSGKKLVIDHYGPGVPIGGGALAGKDPHKVDKCGALRARQLARKLVRGGVDEARVTLGWAAGWRSTVPYRSVNDPRRREPAGAPGRIAPGGMVYNQRDRPRPGTGGAGLGGGLVGGLFLPAFGALGAVRWEGGGLSADCADGRRW